jgi:hypothetical protein
VRIKSFLLFTAICASAQDGVAQSRGAIQFRSTLEFSRSDPRSADIEFTHNGVLYALSIVPDVDVHGDTVALTLVLKQLDAGPSVPNLLEPPGHWHGYQKHIFAASDFARGARASVFGRKRILEIRPLGLLLDFDVSGSRVSALSDQKRDGLHYQFDELRLEIQARSNN